MQRMLPVDRKSVSLLHSHNLIFSAPQNHKRTFLNKSFDSYIILFFSFLAAHFSFDWQPWISFHLPPTKWFLRFIKSQSESKYTRTYWKAIFSITDTRLNCWFLKLLHSSVLRWHCCLLRTFWAAICSDVTDWLDTQWHEVYASVRN